MAVTFDNRQGAAYVPIGNAEMPYRLARLTVDFSETANVMADTDIMKLFAIDADTFVDNVAVRVITADGEACTPDIGDYLENGNVVDVDGYFDAIDFNATGSSISKPGTFTLNEANPNTFLAWVRPYAQGKLYTANSDICLTAAGSGIENAVVEFSVLMHRVF